MKKSVLLLMVGTMLVVGTLTTANAYAPFKKAFEAKYVKAEPSTDAERSLKASVEEAKCLVCHEGKTKKMRNDYGKALDKLLGKADQKNEQKINDALDTVAAEKSPSGETFGDLIKAGKLPGAK